MTKAIIPSGINLSESKDNLRGVLFQTTRYFTLQNYLLAMLVLLSTELTSLINNSEG